MTTNRAPDQASTGDRSGASAAVLEVHEPGAPLLIAFGGISGNLGMPPFEFLRSTGDILAGKIFIRDPHQAWYHRGVPGLGRDIDGVAKSLAGMIANHDPHRVVLVGNSAGGYAALLFSRLVPNVDAAVAFSPQTFIDRRHRLVHRDRRWSRQLNAARQSEGVDSTYVDLRRIMRQGAARNVSTHVFVGREDRLDVAHARRLSDISGVQVHEISDGGHAAVRTLRDQGTLTAVLQASLRGDRALEP
jgi:pimeloyl-ACP methyl ester carboxylesterase